MNRSVLYPTSNITVINDGILATTAKEGVLVLWRVEGLRGQHSILPDDIRNIRGNAAFRRGDIVQESDRLIFTDGEASTSVSLSKSNTESPLPPLPDTWMTWEQQIMGVANGAAKEEYRAIFRGVQFEPDNVKSTNGFMLYMLYTKTPAVKPVVVDAKALNIFKRLRPLEYGFTKHHMVVRGKDFVAWAEYMEGVFPDVERIIPKDGCKTEVSEDWEEVLGVVAPNVYDKVDVFPDGSMHYDGAIFNNLFNGWDGSKIKVRAAFLREAITYVGGAGAIVSVIDYHYPLKLTSRDGKRMALVALERYY